jgi:hypothetical protein
MKFGIEIECWSPKNINDLAAALQTKIKKVRVNPYRSTSSSWGIITDGSLADGPMGMYGVELVSPILDTQKASDLNSLIKICDNLQKLGCMVDWHCGLHVHMDATNLPIDTIKNVFNRYTKFENEIDSFMPRSRRGEIYYARSGKNICTSVSMAETKSALGGVLPSRYYKVNLQALDRHNTIEFRQHSGSINANTILNWVTFLEQFIKASSEPVARKVTRRSQGGMPSACRKVYDVFMASYNNGGGNLFLETIANRTGLAVGSVKVAISKLKTDHGIILKKAPGQRGNTNPLYVIYNPLSAPRVTARSTTTSNGEDMLWRGIKNEIKAYYSERTQELNGFVP